MSLVVKRFKELVRLVDQLLDALTRGIRGLAREHRPDHGESERRGKTRNTDPHQRPREIRIAVLLRLGADFVNFLGVRRVRQVTPLLSNRRIRTACCAPPVGKAAGAPGLRPICCVVSPVD